MASDMDAIRASQLADAVKLCRNLAGLPGPEGAAIRALLAENERLEKLAHDRGTNLIDSLSVAGLARERAEASVARLTAEVERLREKYESGGAQMYAGLCGAVLRRIFETPDEWTDQEFLADVLLRLENIIRRAERALQAQAVLDATRVQLDHEAAEHGKALAALAAAKDNAGWLEADVRRLASELAAANERAERLVLEAEADIKALGIEAHPAVVMRLDRLVRALRPVAPPEPCKHKFVASDGCHICYPRERAKQAEAARDHNQSELIARNKRVDELLAALAAANERAEKLEGALAVSQGVVARLRDGIRPVPAVAHLETGEGASCSCGWTSHTKAWRAHAAHMKRRGETTRENSYTEPKTERLRAQIAENPWLGVCAAVALLQMDLAAANERAEKLADALSEILVEARDEISSPAVIERIAASALRPAAPPEACRFGKPHTHPYGCGCSGHYPSELPAAEAKPKDGVTRVAEACLETDCFRVKKEGA